MSQYKYYIEMIYVNGNTSNTINPENINRVFIDSDYGAANMPIIYAVLNIDKNFYDTIIQNAKVATITLNISKVLYDDSTNTDTSSASTASKVITNYQGACTYFISNDINYNKEIDYATPTNSTNIANATPRQDVYQEVHIGMIYQQCIQYNKQTANCTIQNTTMMNAAANYLQQVPLLIESFTYNNLITQLVVPPQDSLSKTIHFLDSIKVFYDTPYRFFMEPGCIYLISSSGNAVQKKTEQYTTVLFNIHAVSDPAANTLGMMIDTTHNCYTVDINVMDTRYTIDNDTCKTVNNINSIINPSKENSLISLGSIQSSMTQVNGVSSNVLKSINGQRVNILGIPIASSNCGQKLNTSIYNINANDINFTGYLTDFNNQLTQAITLLQVLEVVYATQGTGSGTGTSGSGGTTQQTISTDVDGTVIVTGYINQDIGGTVTITNPQIQALIPIDIDGAITIAAYINQDISGILEIVVNPQTQPTQPTPQPLNSTQIAQMIATLVANKNLMTQYQNQFNAVTTDFKTSSNSLIGGVYQTTTTIPGLLNGISPINISDNVNYLNAVANGAASQNTANQSFNSTVLLSHTTQGNQMLSMMNAIIVELTELATIYGIVALLPMVLQMQSDYSKTQGEVGNIGSTLTSFAALAIGIGSLHSSIGSNMSGFNNLNVNLKAQFTNQTVDIQNTSSNNLTLAAIIGSTAAVLGTLLNVGVSLSTLGALQKDINTILDISQIGKIGVSNFNTGLNFIPSGGGTGTKIVRINNDNANKVKNIKANMENKTNKVTVNKNDLDCTVFTINKQYIISNYDGHSNCDGKFLLNRKTEIFIRQDDCFVLNTMLEFDKLANDPTGGTQASTLVNSTNIVNQIVTVANILAKL